MSIFCQTMELLIINMTKNARVMLTVFFSDRVSTSRVAGRISVVTYVVVTDAHWLSRGASSSSASTSYARNAYACCASSAAAGDREEKTRRDIRDPWMPWKEQSSLLSSTGNHAAARKGNKTHGVTV